MSNRIFKINTLVLVFLSIGIVACKKPAGPGGKAKITGKIFVRDFNIAAYGPPIAEYYSPGESVYICYGTDQTVGNSVKTGTDGSYEFLYLRTGHYKVFANSRDTSIKVAGSNKVIPVIAEVDITSTKQTVTLKDIVINK